MDEQTIDEVVQSLDRLVSAPDQPDEASNFLLENYGLRGNPFPPGGIADATGDSAPLRRDVFDRIINFVRGGYASGRTQFMVVRGDYGSGKTHTLRYIEYVVNTYMSKGNRSARAVYVERPRIEAHELNRAILRSLGYDTVRKYVWVALRDGLLQDIEHPSEEFQRLREDLTTPKVRGKGSKSSEARGFWDDEDPARFAKFNQVFSAEATLDYRTFLRKLEKQGWDREDIRYYLTHLLLQSVGGDRPLELGQTFVALLLAPDEASFASWETLVGSSQTKALSSLRAPAFLQFLLGILKLNGIAYLYLLLDEFEEVSQTALLTLRQRQDYLYTMREVLNKIQNGLSVVIAISPGGWDALLSVATPLADVNYIMVDLPVVRVDDAVRLVEFYFERERFSIPHEVNDISPLSETVLAHILENFPPGAERTPRNLIQFLHRLFNYLVEHRIASVTEDTVMEVLSEFGAMKSSRRSQARGKRASVNAS